MKKKYFIILVLIINMLFVGVYAQDADFEARPFLIKSVLERGESISHSVTIKNFGESQIFEIRPNADFISVNVERLSLDKDEEGNFEVILDSLDYGEDVYVGKIIISGDDKEINIPVTLEIQTVFPLADVSIEVPQGFSGVVPGSGFITDITVHKLKGQIDDFVLEFFVKDFDGEVIYFDQQDLIVDNQITITKIIPIPEDSLGDYMLSVLIRAKTGDSTGTSSFPFSVFPELSPESQEREIRFNYYLFITFGIILVLIISFILFNHFWNRRLVTNAKEWNKKLVDIRKVKFSDSSKEIRKLEYHKEVLENAYNKGYIRKKSYEDGKKKINDLIKRLKKRL